MNNSITEETRTISIEENRVVPKKEKIAYAMPGFTLSLTSQVVAYYLLTFFIKVATIPSNIAWAVFLACSLFDALSDAFSGFYLQRRINPKSLRTYILWTAFPLAIFSVLLFSSPALPLTAKIIYYILAYCVWNTAISLLSIACLSVLPMITQNSGERAKLNSWRLAVSVVTVLLVSSATMPLVNLFGGSSNNPDLAQGFLIIMIIYAVLGLTVQLLSHKFMKLHFTALNKPKEVSVTKGISLVLKDKLTVITLFMYLFYSAANAFRNQTIAFYFADILHRADLMSLFFFITIGFSLLMQFVIPPLIKRIPAEIAALIGFTGVFLSLLFIFLFGKNVISFFIFSALFGIFSALPANLIFLMVARNVDRIYKKHDANISSTAYSLLSFFAKIGAGIGLTVSSAVLSLTGYINKAETQSASAIFGLNLIHVYIPLSVFSIALILMLCITLIQKNQPKH